MAALFLGRLCDCIPRPDEDAVVGVRVEAPTQVDDIVVTYRDGHRSFIQAKESIRDNEAAWKRLWKAFEPQFWGGDFQRDRDWLVLHTGEGYEEHRALRDRLKNTFQPDSCRMALTTECSPNQIAQENQSVAGARTFE